MRLMRLSISTEIGVSIAAAAQEHKIEQTNVDLEFTGDAKPAHLFFHSSLQCGKMLQEMRLGGGKG